MEKGKIHYILKIKKGKNDLLIGVVTGDEYEINNKDDDNMNSLFIFNNKHMVFYATSFEKILINNKEEDRIEIIYKP